ncbi:solute carrier organic anion transporter family member 4A1-like [Paramacrobiotus metropolitanus]|uniref:solute carrier organic anion transporter family member 4A1-like n=1 Tax=Paramacrobiotus metropolitanus TaxID=2943436 RepID=UPI002445FED9|nr:solute carrier organic anion transporter family member 4A1-like [Paramacrobiotus metropolitanus]XP_055339493.1 solute carrier organic anion transporter family member 4A1-like [Paramacrobiotus metropolitanus]
MNGHTSASYTQPLERRRTFSTHTSDEEDSDLSVDGQLMDKGIRSRHGSATASPGNGLVSPFYVDTEEREHRRPAEEKEEECGCGPCRPRWMQYFNGPKCLLAWLCIAAFAQGMIVNGLINVVITTIERRFHLTSSQSGLIASTYDISSLVFLLPVSYFGGMGNRARWLAVGSAVLGVGCILFTVPHYITESYNAAEEVSTACRKNISQSQSALIMKECSSPLENYRYFFIVAQILHGAGAAPLYTLGVSFLDDSVKPKLSSMYVGIYYAFAMLGPACGFLLGGQFLTIFVDFDRLSSWTMSPNSPAWVGAWWLGFLGAGIISLLTAIPLFMFPAMLSHTLDYRQQRKNETHADVGEVPTVHTTVTGNLHALPKAIKTLLINRTFIFLNLAGAADAFLTLGLATYAPKVFQSMFGFNASLASIIIGAATIPFGAGGTLLGGWIIKRWGLDCRGILKVCVICSFLALLCVLIFLIRCPNEQFAGVNVPYKNQSGILKSPVLSASCNAQCSCDEMLYDPVCSMEDNIAYLTPCHAGCREHRNGEPSSSFYDCACIGISSNASKPVAVKTSCSTNCGIMHWVFIAFFALLILFTFLSSIPAVSATLRCVVESQRPFAMGMQWIIVRLFGSVPGPLCFGAIIDTVCRYWQPERCGSGKGRCLSYDNAALSNAVFTIGIVGKVVCFTFFVLAWWFYKPAKKPVMSENPSDVGLANYVASVNVSTQSLDHPRSGRVDNGI